MQTYYVKFKCLITGQIAIAPVQAQSQLHAEYKAGDYPYCGPTYVVVRTV